MEEQPAKMTPGTGAKSPRKAQKGGLENVRGGKQAAFPKHTASIGGDDHAEG